MATGTLTGSTIAGTYKSLLKVTGSENEVLDASTTKVIEDGDGNPTPLKLSQDTVDINSGFELAGSAVTASATELNVMDGSATTQATVTLEGTDGVVISDGDTMKQALVSDFDTYGISTLQTLTNKSIDADNNTITNIDASELGVTAGTVTASKAVVVDANKQVDAMHFSGNVGIGTDSPDANTKLDVAGVIRASGGIQPNGNAYSASEVLDDYEEGTWTGSLTSTTPPTAIPTAVGTYVKIGRQVTVNINLNNKDTSGGSGQMYITGLPFAVAAYHIGSYASHSLEAQGSFGSAFAVSSIIEFMETNDASGWGSVQMVAGTGKYLYATVTYQV